MTFKDGLDDDFANVFLATGEFAETVTVYANGKAAGGGRAISALVDRGRPEPLGLGEADELVLGAEVTIANNATTGLSAIVEDVTEFDLALVEGGPDVTVRVVEIITQDPGAWGVRVVK